MNPSPLFSPPPHRRSPFLYIPLIALVLAAAAPALQAEIANGQGEQAGEVTADSVILHSRLTKGTALVEGDQPGHAGEGRFQLALNPAFTDALQETEILSANAENDYLIKTVVTGLEPDTRYHYRLLYRASADQPFREGSVRTFRTLAPDSVKPVSFAVVTGLNYGKFHGEPGAGGKAYQGDDRDLGYPGLEAIRKAAPDYLIGTGDNVYYDHPKQSTARTPAELRKKWHQQFAQPRMIDLLGSLGVYWEKDDHDHRKNDCDTTGDYEPSNELGIALFREQVPVVPPGDDVSPTYRTHRLNRNLQIWLPEGRDHRSPNQMPDGPEKTLWGAKQLAWMKESLLASDAPWKVIVSPTPMIGPDDAYKSDNHTNPKGFRHEGDAFKAWIREQGEPFASQVLFVCGDRHWQYHSIDPNGHEEFSCGTLVEANARTGRLPGDPKSTDPNAEIQQPYVHAKSSQVTGSFLLVECRDIEEQPVLSFRFYDEQGALLYEHEKVGDR